MKLTPKILILVIGSLFLALFPFIRMMLLGVYRWHETQPEFWQGGIELILFGIIMVILWIVMKKKTILPMLILSSLYLSVNGVIIPVLTSVLYFECLQFIGAAFLSLNKKYMTKHILERFIAGICIWGAGAILFSLLGLGQINDLRIYSVCLLLLSLIIKRKKIYYNTYTKFEHFIRYNITTIWQYITITGIILVVLALFAKTNTAQDYDSLWYGLRPQYVLVGHHSFYDNLGYASQVYYYPKLMELLYLPISGLGDYSFLQCANVWVFAFILYIIYSFIKKYQQIPISANLGIVCVISTIPAVANISATAKPDTLGTFLILLAFTYCLDYFQNKKMSSAIWSGITLLLCTGTKLTCFLWGGIMAILFLILLFIDKRKDKTIWNTAEELKMNAIMILSSLFLVIGIHLRTYMLTGVPIYPRCMPFWKTLGFQTKAYLYSVKEPRLNPDMSLLSFLNRLKSFFLDPSDLGHIVMLWTSNLYIIAIIAFLFYKKKHIFKNCENIFEIALLGIYPVVMIYYVFTLLNPDGNYFILPIIVILLLCIKNIKTSELRANATSFGIIIVTYIIFQAPIMFVSHSSWAYGTKAFSKEIIADNFETKTKNQSIFYSIDMMSIENKVSQFQTTDRVISSGSISGNDFRLSCSLETYRELMSHTNPNLTKDYLMFEKYLGEINIKALIVSKTDETNFPLFVQKYINTKNIVSITETSNAICYEVR